MDRITPLESAEQSLLCEMDACGNPGRNKLMGKWYCSFHSSHLFQDHKQRHPSSARFHELLKAIGDLHDRKSADYGVSTDPLANVRASKDWNMPSWVGAAMRADDKMKRLKAFAANGRLANESFADSCMDMAVYALIALVLYEEDHP